jgi:hypothetical protein
MRVFLFMDAEQSGEARCDDECDDGGERESTDDCDCERALKLGAGANAIREWR